MLVYPMKGAPVKIGMFEASHSRGINDLGHEEPLESLFIERMELNEDLFTDYMGKPEMQELVSKWLGSQVYDRLSAAKKAGP